MPTGAPVLNIEDYELLNNALGQAFDEGFRRGEPMDVGMTTEGTMAKLADLAMIVASSTLTEQHPFTVFADTLREWIGPRLYNQVAVYMANLTNRDFEDSVKVNANHVADNGNLALPRKAAEHLGYESQRHWVKLMIEAMTSNANWLDGLAFFSDSRTYGDNTIDNLIESALSHGTFNTAVQQMSEFVAHNGEPLECSPTHLVYGPALRTTAHAIIKADRVETGSNGVTTNNPNQNKLVGVESKRLVGAYANYWFIADCSGVIKPALVQQRKIASLVGLTSPTDANVFERNELVWGVHQRGAAMLTLPHLMIGGRV